jgi:anaerobic selenocysteine-containing dehydrogenase
MISPPPGKEKSFFRNILNVIEKGKGGSREIKELIKMIENAPSTTFILGPEIADLTDGKEILQSIEKIADRTAAKIFAPNPYGNLTGMLSLTEIKLSEEIYQMVEEEKIDLLYIIGDAPFHKRPPVDFIIHQSSFPPPDKLSANLVLPTATWGEISGTYAYAGIHEKMKKTKAVVKPPGMALENQDIFARIAKTMGIKEPTFTPKAISNQIPKNLSIKLPRSKGKSFKKANVSSPDTHFHYLLVQERTPHAIHNMSLCQTIAGMEEILPEDTIIMNPVDASKVRLSDGDSVLVESADHSKIYPLKLQNIISPGIVFLLTHAKTPVFNSNPCPVHLRRKDV